jgi:RHS repeat-associated protein
MYGSNKGALGTLLDRRGDDADQVILLVTLWNAAGFTAAQTGYYNELLPLSGDYIANWFGVPNNCKSIGQVLGAGGFAVLDEVPVISSCTPSEPLTSISVNHFIAALCLGGNGVCGSSPEDTGIWYYFDPSYKFHTLVSGVSGLATVLGYSRSQFLADAGGTVTSDPGGSASGNIANVNRSKLRSDLSVYATNLVNYINQNNPAWTVGDVIGGKIIQPLTGSPIRYSNSSYSPSTTFPVDCPNQDITSECRAYITIQLPGVSTPPMKVYSDAIYAHRITIFSTPTFAEQYSPTLLIDGAVPGCVSLGTCSNVGNSESVGENWIVGTTIVEPNQPPETGCVVTATACQNLTIAAGGSFLVSTGFGQVGRNMAEYHRQLLAQARALGNADSSEAVLGESLAALGYNWLAESSYQEQVTDQINQTTTTYNFALGIVGQADILQFGYQGPYIDLPVNYLHSECWYNTCPTLTFGGITVPAAFVSSSYVLSQVASALESDVLLQTQAPVANMTAASSMTLIDANMNSSYPGALDTTFFADGTTSGGRDYFLDTISGQISSNYSASDLATIDNAVAAGEQVLIPQNGILSVGLWQGAGFTATQFAPSVSGLTIYQLITGGMSGGFSGEDITDPPPNVEITLLGSGDDPSLDTFYDPIPWYTDPFKFEPVDSVTGAYVYSHDDLVTGGNGFPYALPFSRTYLSSSGTYLTTTTADTGMGNGWTNTYSINAQVDSDPYIGIGSTSSPAISAASSVAALYVMQDLMSVVPTVQTMTFSSMTAHWLADQLTSNIVLVTQPKTTEEYVALPHADGSASFPFSSPSGSSVRFSQVAAGQFTYVQKNGTTLNFGPSPTGALQSWVFPTGMTVSLSYNGSGQLTEITNNLGRSLTLGYNSGNDIATVEDDTGRTVTYGYDGNHNLTSSSDPLTHTTNFVYDTSGIYDSAGHLTQIFYPTTPTTPFVTNTYDALGRVNFQANADGNVSDFYITDTRTELVDALGNREISYRMPMYYPTPNDVGSIDTDAWVLSGTTDVFSDTLQQNGVVDLWTNQYDGLGRLALGTAPEGDTTTYTYQLNPNPWANDIATVTRNPKPGSSLSPLLESFTYDPVWNKPTTATDPLGLVILNQYSPTTGELVRTTADNSSATGHLNATNLFTYNSVGQVLTAIDPRGSETLYAYGSYGNQSSVTRSYGVLNQLTSYEYDAWGDVNQVQDPNGNITTSTFNANRKLQTLTLPIEPPNTAPLVTAYSYDVNNQLIQTQQSMRSTVLRTTSSTYAVTGKTATTTDANGNVTTLTYDANDRLLNTSDPVGNVTSYVYDAMSRQTQVLNTAIQSTPLMQIAYEPDGTKASLTDANDNTTSYAYDGLNRLSVATYPMPTGGSATTENYTYDADSNVLTFITRRGNAFSYAYDTLNRVCTKTIATTATLCSATSSSNPTTWYAYDLAGHLASANDNSAAITSPVSRASYATDTEFDSLNNPTNVSWNPAPLQAAYADTSNIFTDRYDANNRRINQTAANSSWWSYPTAAGNLCYSTNALNQYSEIGSFGLCGSSGYVMPTYDGNGNLTYDGLFTYYYDAESRLTSVMNGTSTVATYDYDAQSRRKSKTVGSTTTMYVTDADDREVLEYDGTSGAQENWYTYGLGSNDALNKMNLTAASRQTLVPDIQGSMIVALDSGTGSLNTVGYQTFGESPGLTTPGFHYTAQRFDPETAGSTEEPNGLYYYRMRMYSPTLGRFLQPDSAGYGAGMNLYAYANNDPMDRTDPSGNQDAFVEGMGAAESINMICSNGGPNCTSNAAVAIGAGYIGGGALGLSCIAACPEIGAATLIKGAVGFELGYGFAGLSGSSPAGQWTEGGISAVTSAFIAPGLANLVQGPGAQFGVGLLASGASGFGGNVAAQYVSNEPLNYLRATEAGLSGALGYSFFGEGLTNAWAASNETSLPLIVDVVNSVATESSALLIDSGLRTVFPSAPAQPSSGWYNGLADTSGK